MLSFKKCVGLACAGLLACSTANAYEAIYGPTGILHLDKEKAYDGYTLLAPNSSHNTYLINNEGQILHTWEGTKQTGSHAELLPNGNLLRAANDGPFPFVTGALSGLLQEFNWEGEIVAEYKMNTDKEVSHHTFHRMPNGNTLLLGFEAVSQEKAKSLGRKKLFEPVKFGKLEISDFWLDFVREVTPKGKIVWEWHLIDHVGANQYDKIDINYNLPKAAGKLYQYHDLTHGNTVDYLPETDQVLVNLRNYSEFYLINHKTGKIEYRWGNPTTYDPKAEKPSWVDAGDQVLFGPHAPYKLENGNFLIFDNGAESPLAHRSRAVEMDPKTGEIVWQYGTKMPNSFLSQRQGSAQRLPNGNTIICSSANGHIFEVTKDGDVAWEFVNPFVKGKAKTRVSEKNAIPEGMGLMDNDVHRIYKYSKDYSAFAGKDLSPKGYFAGDDAPVFYKDWHRGALTGNDEYADEEDDEEEDEEEEGTMAAY